MAYQFPLLVGRVPYRSGPAEFSNTLYDRVTQNLMQPWSFAAPLVTPGIHHQENENEDSQP